MCTKCLLCCCFCPQLKAQLTQTVSKLQTEDSERQKVAGDLYKVGAAPARPFLAG